jgi:hypothetical protein
MGTSIRLAREDHVHKYSAGGISVATSSVLGGVKAGGSNMNIADDGVISCTVATTSTAATAAPLDCSTSASSIGVSDKYAREDHVHKFTSPALPVASANTLGGVKAGGANITIDANGVISSTASGGGTLPIASSTVLGGVRAGGANITIDSDGVISGTVPTATSLVLGGVKSGGDNIAIDSNGVISASIPTATSLVLGGVRSGGSNITIDSDGVVSASVPSIATAAPVDISEDSSSLGISEKYAREDHVHKFTVPVATSDTLGGVKSAGQNILIDSSGRIHATMPFDYSAPPDISTTSGSRGDSTYVARGDHTHKFTLPTIPTELPVNICAVGRYEQNPATYLNYGSWSSMGTLTTSDNRTLYIWVRTE